MDFAPHPPLGTQLDEGLGVWIRGGNDLDARARGRPVMQMYLLPQQLEKKRFAATSCAFFWMLNLIKLLPFAMLGRIQPENLKLGAALLPVIPLGVALGWWLTHKTEQKHYTLLIYVVLFITSVALIVKALRPI